MRIFLFISLFTLLPGMLPGAVAIAPVSVNIQPELSSAALSRKAVEERLGRGLKFRERVALAFVRGKMKRAERKAARQQPARKTDSFAVLSLFASLLVFVNPLLVLAGIAFGVVGLVRIGKRPGARKGRGYAIAGIIVSVVFLGLYFAAVGALMDAIANMFGGM